MPREIIYTVFVSSTYEDLRQERAEVQKALLKLHCLPIGMELFPSADEETWEFIKRQIAAADYYVVVIAGRYGSVASDGKSFTEKEYDYAREIGKRVLAFVYAERGMLPRNRTEEEPEKNRKLESFIKKVERSPVNYFLNAHELAAQVTVSFVNLRERYPATGFIRANEVAELEKYAELLEDNARLQPLNQALGSAIAMAESAFKRSGRTTGVPTGFTDLDNGEPVSEDGAVVAFFSMEMSAEQLATRVLSCQSHVASDLIRRGEVSLQDFDQFVLATQNVASVPLFIDDTRPLTIGALRARARRLLRQQGLGLIIIDFLQLLRSEHQGRTAEDRLHEASDIIQDLKALAGEINVPIVALSQVSPAVEGRENKRPTLSDLQEFGSIEDYADVVLLLYREEHYLSRSEPTHSSSESYDKFNSRYARWIERIEAAHGLAEVLIAKQRHGSIGKVTLRFDPETSRFSDLVRL